MTVETNGSPKPPPCEESKLIRQLKSELAACQLELADSKRTAQQYQAVVAGAPVVLWIIDLDRRIVAVEGSGLQTLGLTRDQLIGRVADTALPELKPDLDANIEQILSGKTATATTAIQGRFFQTKAKSWADDTGKLAGIIGVSVDITPRIKAQDALVEEKERLGATLSSIADAVICTDTKARIEVMNPRAESLTGWSADQVIGQGLDSIFYAIDERTREFIGNPAVAVLTNPEGGPVTVEECVLVGKDGRETLICATASPISHHNGQVIGSVVVFRDVSRLRVLEDDMHRIEKLESVGLLAGGIAHDFNNILTAVMGNISLARRRTTDDRALARMEDAEKAVIRAKDLTNQLLTFSKGGAPIKTLASARELIEDSAEFSLSGSSAKCEILVDDELWAVEVDVGQITQVIQNLVINADQAMPDGGQISIDASNQVLTSSDGLPVEPGMYVRISIADQGTGIAADHLEQVFDPYFTTKREGTGLGLATSYSIMRRHGGHITATSTEGVGTTFQIFLPASQGRPSGIYTPLNLSPPRTKGNILVMDDDPQIRSVAKQLLTELGFESEIVADGYEAIDLYHRRMSTNRPFDAVIMDLTIPGGIGGKEAVNLLKRIDIDATVLVSSGYSNDPIMANFASYGFCGVLTKPYGVDALSAALSKALTQHGNKD